MLRKSVVTVKQRRAGLGNNGKGRHCKQMARGIIRKLTVVYTRSITGQRSVKWFDGRLTSRCRQLEGMRFVSAEHAFRETACFDMQ